MTLETIFTEYVFDGVKHSLARNPAKLIDITQQFSTPLDTVPRGWKTVCVFGFLNEVPEVFRALPSVDTWYASESEIVLIGP